ncbi:MAG: hypothetical protein IKE23_06485 [Exiguobacterium sp.]|nr:hypothetical protein [Exiguobacterium sp.]
MARTAPKPSRATAQRKKEVPYEEWGKYLDGRDRIDLRDKNGDYIGYVEDVTRYDSVEDIRKVSLREAIDELFAWQNDKDEDGWSYGNGDTSFFVAYKDGTQMGDDDLNGKKFKKTGIIGVAIQTGDFEMVAGDEWIRRDGRIVREPIQTWSEDGESGLTNSYSGYKSTEKWIERVETTFNNPVTRRGYDGEPYTAYVTKRRVLRRSTKVPVGKHGW